MSAEEKDSSSPDSPDVTPASPQYTEEELAIGPTPSHGYWRTLAELEGKAKIQETGRTNREFPPGAGEDRPIDPLSRRNFFQLMGASMALAGVASCRYEKEEIVPLARRPEDQTPGVTQQYATVFDLAGVATPILATSFEGRPIHLEGNAEHPWHGGGIVAGTERHAGLTTFAQASILHLYDPDRSKAVTHDGKGSTIDAFRGAIGEIRKKLGGAAAILTEASSSPTVAAFKRQLQSSYAGLAWHEYEAISYDNERAGLKMAFQRPLRALAKLDKCSTIVALDCDIFIDHPAAHRYSRDFSKSRRMDGSLGIGKMNRLWSAESQFSHTGAMADHRLAVRSEHVYPLALALDAALSGVPNPKLKSNFLTDTNVRTWVSVLVRELTENKQKGLHSVVLAGRRQPPEVHAMVAHINAQLNAAEVLEYYEDGEDRLTHAESIKALAADIKSKKIQTLIILGGNPAYNAPSDLDFGALLASVPESVHLSEYADETSAKAKWHVPRTHYLEAWGDARTIDGTYTLAQPLIAPLHGGVSAIELLSMLAGNEQTGEALVKNTHDKGMNLSPLQWRQHVAAGFVASDPKPAPVGAPQAPAVELTKSQESGMSKRGNGDIEVTFAVSPFAHDGRFANNAWLQETPDFMSKVTWDNFAYVGTDVVSTCHVENDHMMKVAIDGKTLDVACYTIPGQAPGTITLVLGGGRTMAGKVGGDADRTVGFDTNKVRTTNGFDIGLRATLTPGDKFELASVQEHWDIRIGLVHKVTQEGIAERLPELIRETTAKSFLDKPQWRAEPETEFFNDLNLGGDKDRRESGGFSLFKEKDYSDHHRWGMAIDLSTCTGCNSCTVACQSENNIPVVGKKEIFNNREMSWIRIDRYFAGSPEDPQVVHQPVGCQHCEQAPCEQVCPVGATTHSDEGLNDMAYNRCIGTRYCANNCPYKVRRFNFLDWNKEFRDARNKVRRLLFNPDVTVRMRGVMEKCSFCVQRIQNAKIKQKAEHRAHWPADAAPSLVDGTIVTACQAACPTEAIVFGDLSDKESRVAKLHADRRAYDLLPETYTKPRNRFLARVRNPSPNMPKASAADAGEHH